MRPAGCILSTFLGSLNGKILNLELSFELNLPTKKKVCINKSRYYCLYVKKKTSCVSLSIYIFHRLTYKMKDEINN